MDRPTASVLTPPEPAPAAAPAPARPLPDPASSRPTPATVAFTVGAWTVLALILRLAGIGEESIWYDEAYTLRIAAEPLAGFLSGRVFDPGNPCGYFVLLKLWQGLFGESLEAARAFSAVGGALAVPATWLLARRCGSDRTTAHTAALLVAVSPPLVYLGREARVFALFAAVTTWLACFARTSVDRRRERPGRLFGAADVGLVLCGALLLHLHYYAFFVLMLLGLWHVFQATAVSMRAVAATVAAYLLMGLAFAPYLPVLLEQLRLGAARSAETWQLHVFLQPLYAAVGRTLVWKEDGRTAVAAVTAALVVLVWLPVAWQVWRRRLWPTLPFFLAVALPLLVTVESATLKPMVHSRYLTAVTPCLLVVVAAALVAGLRRGRWMLVPAAALGLATVAALASLYHGGHKDDWRRLAATIRVDAPEAPVAVWEDLGGDPLRHYLPRAELHPFTQMPDDDAPQWDAWAGRVRRAGDGWLAYYGTAAVVAAHREAALRRLGRLGRVEVVPFEPHLELWRVRPRRR